MGCNQSKSTNEKKEKEEEPLADTKSGSRVREDHNASPRYDNEVVDESEPTVAPTNSKYKSGGPKYPDGLPIRGDEAEIFECFKDGLLYRIVRGDEWYFYNDTSEYEMHVLWKFGPESKIHAAGNTTFKTDENQWIIATLIIYPGDTEPFIVGKYNGYKSNMSAKPLSDAYRQRVNAEAHQKVAQELEKVTQVAGNRKSSEEILSSCLIQKVPYVDLNFPPLDSSLSRPKIDKRSIPSQAWKRPRDYLPPKDQSRVKIFRKIEPNDIDQGQLGDCWFLCSVASLAEFPKKIEDVFRHPVSEAKAKEEAAIGAYRVTLNKHGWWQVYILDDYFPVIGNRPCYAKNIEDPSELWVSLLEKAYAKAHGSYSSITGGDALHALQDLTGYPINRFDTEWEDALKSPEKSDELFNDLVRYDEHDYLINLNTPGQDNTAYQGAISSGNSKAFEEKYKKAGLGMGHAYSVLQVKRFPNFEGKRELRLLQIRNPWGSGMEWTGKWSDNDASWNNYPDIARACGFAPAADGTFWMEWESVKEYFDGGGVCFMETNWFDYRAKGAFVHGFPNLVLEVTCKKRTKAFVSIAQKDKRGLPENDPEREYAAMMLSVSKGIGNGRQQVHLNSSSDADKPSEAYTFNFARDLSLLYTFEPSEQPYLVIPRIFDSGASKAYVLGLIAENKAEAGNFSIRFRTLDKNCKVFQNYPKFPYSPEESSTAFETEYQFNPEVGVPVTKKGTELVS